MVPLFANGTGAQAERLRRVLRRLTGRDISLAEDTTATLVEALESIAARLQALEHATSARVQAGQSQVDQ